MVPDAAFEEWQTVVMIDTHRIPRSRDTWPIMVYVADDARGRVENVTFDGIGGTLYARTPTQSLWYCNLPNAGECVTVRIVRSGRNEGDN